MSDITNNLFYKNFRFFVESKIKEVSKIEDLKERYNEYNNLLGTFDEDIDFASDIKEKIEKEIIIIKEDLDKLVEKGKELDTVKESSEKLSEELKTVKEEVVTLTEKLETVQKKYDESCKLLEDTKLYTNKVRDLYEISKAEKNGMITATEYKELSTFTEEKEAEILKLKEEVLKLKEMYGKNKGIDHADQPTSNEIPKSADGTEGTKDADVKHAEITKGDELPKSTDKPISGDPVPQKETPSEDMPVKKEEKGKEKEDALDGDGDMEDE